MGLFKDEDTINQKKAEETYLKALREKCERATQRDGSLNKAVLRDELRINDDLKEDKAHHHNHQNCDGCKTSKRTEKRVCKCIFYYNSRYKKDCMECKLCLKKWNNMGKIAVKNYEIPMSSVYKNVGGIDLVLNYEGVDYGVEVKPWYSKETISRMVAEILTYTSAIEEQYKPAILVFDNSDQYKTIKKLDGNEDWKEIKKHIKVFVLYTPDIDLKNKKNADQVDFFIEEYRR